MLPLSLIPFAAKLKSWIFPVLAFVGVMLILWYMLQTALSAAEEKGYLRAHGEFTDMALRQAEENRKNETALRLKVSNLEVTIDEQKHSSRLIADSARGERDRLLKQLAKATGNRGTADNPAAAPGFDEAAATRTVLGACATEYTAMAEDADGTADKLGYLQRYVREVCVPSVAASTPLPDKE